jgi:hypothetical protein
MTVADTGIGIPEEEIVHLGRRFHRVHTPGGRSNEGTGIGASSPHLDVGHFSPDVGGDYPSGLAMVYELVRLHGGTIEASSQLGKGKLPIALEREKAGLMPAFLTACMRCIMRIPRNVVPCVDPIRDEPPTQRPDQTHHAVPARSLPQRTTLHHSCPSVVRRLVLPVILSLAPYLVVGTHLA